jgi:hypothetical protein
MAISRVELKGQYYHTWDENNKEIAEAFIGRDFGNLLGYSSEFILFKRGQYYCTYDERFKPIAEVYDGNGFGNFQNVFGATINFQNGNYIFTFDKFLKKKSERRI